MKLLNKNTEWFFSGEGTNSFCALASLEERISFIYSYLRNILPQCLDEHGVVFKTAFFLADSDSAFDNSFSEYPRLIAKGANPFILYLTQIDFCPTDTALYAIFSAILHEKVDVKDKNEWIYNKALLESEELAAELGELGLAYLPPSDLEMADRELYELDEHKGLLQLKLAWLFLR